MNIYNQIRYYDALLKKYQIKIVSWSSSRSYAKNVCHRSAQVQGDIYSHMI